MTTMSAKTKPIARCTEHLGETCGMTDHDHDLVQELSTRLDCLWRCDQCIANADGHDEVMGFWRDIKKQEQKNIERLRTLISSEVKHNCF